MLSEAQTVFKKWNSFFFHNNGSIFLEHFFDGEMFDVH